MPVAAVQRQLAVTRLGEVELRPYFPELVINALKHAFPNSRNGTISLDYQSNSKEWALSVGDDGIDTPVGPDAAMPGLGTGIVEALARQLDAVVDITNQNPGTLVSIRHA